MNPRLLVLGFAAAFTAVVFAQQPPPTFRAQVEAIQVDAFVTDRAGNPVTNLRFDDFEIVEDVKPQVIASLSEVNIAPSRSQPRPEAPRRPASAT